ncbi:NYN domain-containing protein [Pantanalinema sp. GBBB05]|uniref:LabA-like NYN domain-containing protein n=1 Tax=Pantanalinema sp. GBBB05 TaxID=2604139 RepID=UPI001D9502B6|nr:NYN domain-containing protein [Pantanalinema sp. GBBB05]
MQALPKRGTNGKSSFADQALEPFLQSPIHLPNDFNDRDPQGCDRVGIFIDGSNLFYAALNIGIEIDYAKLLCKLTGHRRLLRAYFYTGIDPNNERQQGFLLWMRRNGYRVVTKELIQFPDGSKKANLDVEIAVDMMTLAHHCDTMVLLSGDGDLAYVVNAITYLGTQVEVVSLPSMTSESLINVADRYTDLSSLRQDIQK